MAGAHREALRLRLLWLERRFAGKNTGQSRRLGSVVVDVLLALQEEDFYPDIKDLVNSCRSLYSFAGPQRQLFRGWVIFFAWAGAGQLFVLEGKPDLNGLLWRVGLEGSRPERPSASLVLRRDFYGSSPLLRFDVHPDHRRIVVEALELNEADLGMIENVR